MLREEIVFLHILDGHQLIQDGSIQIKQVEELTDPGSLIRLMAPGGLWHSEKLLRMGTAGERKVPDGFFTHNGKGIAVEVGIYPPED